MISPCREEAGCGVANPADRDGYGDIFGGKGKNVKIHPDRLLPSWHIEIR
jgi:hypothetical protein